MTQSVRKPAILLAVTAYFGVLLLIAAGLWVTWQRAGVAPDQPIAFPHTIHVSKLNLPCNFCHIFVDRSRHAGAPFLETCLACHRAIATEKDEIRKRDSFDSFDEVFRLASERKADVVLLGGDKHGGHTQPESGKHPGNRRRLGRIQGESLYEFDLVVG